MRYSFSGNPLSLGHWAEAQAALSRYRPGLSEFSFSNLFLFRAIHDYRFEGLERLLITGRTYDGRPHVMPLYDWRTAAESLLEFARRTGAVIYPVPEDALAGVTGRFKICDHLEDADYIYATDAIADYPGAALKPKRQLARAFEAAAAPRVEPVTLENGPQLRQVLEGWLADVGRPLAQTDFAPCNEAIAHLEYLDLFGLLARDGEGRPLAFVLAGEVADDMAAIHFAKARKHPPGALPFLFREFARRHGERYRWLNFEQDLGNPGFRQNKRSFAPVRLARKYRIEPI